MCLTGARARVSAPIWADFMLRATALPAYRDVKEFTMPPGVQSVLIDPETLELATANCPTTREEVYVAGSAPTQFCELHGGHPLPATSQDKQPGTVSQQPGDPAGETADKKKNPLQKIFGIFGGKKKDS